MSIHSKLPRPSNIEPKTSMKSSNTKTMDLKNALGST